MIKLIASDMDGTLLNSKMQISQKNIDAIKKAQANGIEFLIATGRAPAESKKLVQSTGVKTGFINLNGAMVFNSQGKLMVKEPIKRDKALEIIHLLEKTGYYFEIITAEHVYSNSRMHRIANFAHLVTGLNKNISFKRAVSVAAGSDQVLKVNFVKDYRELISQPNFEVMKLIAFNDRGEEAFVNIKKDLSKLGDIVVTASGANNIEVNSIKAQKGIALMDYAKLRGYKKQEVAAIGDNLNDESMISMAGCGVAMANAIPKIKELASFVTKNNNEDGVAYAIEHFLSEK
ncbi:Cof-type HAD-IIB family hydrolase [uncultured Lactobacillus sp.]|uniref:Cof-type HAD-IIB family hydrolase n=1 Tax=uncultured Lactobacillus sp. TaxID=153152 RepID=UPI002608B5E9|nr:Cof-type HAD-IIB family hydrolase [uncultured Lactobacillus sp.]